MESRCHSKSLFALFRVDEQVVEQGDLQLGTQLPRSPTLEALQRSVMNAFALKYSEHSITSFYVIL